MGIPKVVWDIYGGFHHGRREIVWDIYVYMYTYIYIYTYIHIYIYIYGWFHKWGIGGKPNIDSLTGKLQGFMTKD